MKTLVAMVSVGTRSHLTDYSFTRLSKWAARQGYSATLIKESLHAPEQLPHYSKLYVHKRFPGFDRYCIVDDDLMISINAPSLPELPSGHVGLAKDAEQHHTTADFVDWTGNTGFIVYDSAAAYLLDEATKIGDVKTIWPFKTDQPALNKVLWEQQKIVMLDQRWNFQAVLEFYNKGRGWFFWSQYRLYRASYFLGVATGLRVRACRELRAQHGVHLIHGVKHMPMFDKALG